MKLTKDDIGKWFRMRNGSYVIITKKSKDLTPYSFVGTFMTGGKWRPITFTAKGAYSVKGIFADNDLVKRVTDIAEIAKLELMYETHRG